MFVRIKFFFFKVYLILFIYFLTAPCGVQGYYFLRIEPVPPDLGVWGLNHQGRLRDKIFINNTFLDDFLVLSSVGTSDDVFHVSMPSVPG